MQHGPAAPPHPLAALLIAAADGVHPQADGGWHRVPPWRPGLEAVLAFTGHAVLAVRDDLPDRRLEELGVDGLGGAHDPRVVATLAGPDGWVDSLDVLLGRRGTGSTAADPPLVDRPDLAAHHRVRLAAELRDACRVLGYRDRSRSAVAVVARGVAGLTELSFELEAARRGAAGGRALVLDALGTVPAGELVLAAVAPGNVASLRTLLSVGFTPLASLQLFRRGG